MDEGYTELKKNGFNFYFCYYFVVGADQPSTCKANVNS